MELPAPLDGEVVRVLDDPSHELLGVDDFVLVGNHPTRDSEDSPKDSDVEEDRPSWGDLEMEEGVRVDEGEEDENGGEGSGEEGDEAGYEGCLLLGELVDIRVGDGVGAVESLLEEVGELVELAELPACELSELARAD